MVGTEAGAQRESPLVTRRCQAGWRSSHQIFLANATSIEFPVLIDNIQPSLRHVSGGRRAYRDFLAHERQARHPCRQTVAQVDFVSLVSELVRGLDLTFLTETERLLEAARFVARPEQETARLSHDYHAVILGPPAVISGAPDLTDASWMPCIIVHYAAHAARYSQPPGMSRQVTRQNHYVPIWYQKASLSAAALHFIT